jgi:PAS domain S-box-containing protein
MQIKKTSPSIARKRTGHRLTPLKDGTREGMFQSIVELGNDGILVFDDRYRIVYANRMASEITGAARNNLIGSDFFAVMGKGNKEFLEGTVIRGEGLSQKRCTEIRRSLHRPR